MKITICGSIAFYDEMLKTEKELQLLGHEVKLPPNEIEDDNGEAIPVQEYYARRQSATRNDTWIWDRKEQAIVRHFDKVAWADAILVLNHDKKGVPGYIGGNTLMEMGLALYLKKPTYLLNEIPQMSHTEEILGMKPIVINGVLENIKKIDDIRNDRS
ncbi:MAG: hypothetical protein A3G60_01815 [Candidatus Ryanbacteria bacterium RIFCSPLOWO2_12_FULL_47_9c]|uniref:Nucleoside 2-deoxyribosyltransferase n=1 Tax=Candidatus Ryanbacteria bacterium RIFCSPLOWO2_12_FULL_47_9c TaxID=1802131 RepID=A0A1G2H167_9BACT|nr:MAG: hypothetical protein A3G60_01815 [Candidatus Ryanbacteria bacterium RIFCSPLOWO2_12_FULL_47_9c]